jgi:tetratricopeptide (TPR) repeat protein
MYLCLVPAVVFHEIGHAIASKAVGFPLRWISIGHGRELFDKRIFGVRWRVSLIPFSGVTMIMPHLTSWLRLRLWLVVAAGPAVNIALIVICYFIFSADFYAELFYVIPDIFSGVAPVEAFVCANMILLLSSFFSKWGGNFEGMLYSDGYQLLKIPTLTEQQIAEYETLPLALEAREEVESGNIEKAIVIYEKALSISPKSVVIRNDMALARLLQGHYEEAREVFLELLHSEENTSPDYRALFLNNVAWTDLILRKDELLSEADKYSEEAMRLNPKNLNIKGTRGSVLVSIGNVEEGLILLKEVFPRHADLSARASVACWIAIGEARLDNMDEASMWLQKARQSSPGHYSLNVAEQEVQRIFSSQ